MRARNRLEHLQYLLSPPSTSSSFSHISFPPPQRGNTILTFQFMISLLTFMVLPSVYAP